MQGLEEFSEPKFEVVDEIPLTSASLAKNPPRLPQVIIPGFLAKQRIGIVFGPPGCGKSTALWHLSGTLALGDGTFLGGRYQGTPLKTMVVLAENSAVEFHALGKSQFGPDIVKMETRLVWDTLDRDWVPNLRSVAGMNWMRRIIELHKPDVVVLDSLSALVPDGLEASDVAGRVMGCFRYIVRQFDLALLIAAHARKTKDGEKANLLGSLFGSQVWAAQADLLVALHTGKTKDFRHAFVAKNRGNPDHHACTFEVTLDPKTQVLSYHLVDEILDIRRGGA